MLTSTNVLASQTDGSALQTDVEAIATFATLAAGLNVQTLGSLTL